MDKKYPLIYPAFLIVYVLLFALQFNQPPMERYPGWDSFWGSTLQAGKLDALKMALSQGELPAINPYVHFGWNNIGDTTLPQSYLCPLNWLVFFISPGLVILIKTLFLLAAGALGAYFYLRLITKNEFLSFLGGLSYISLPFVIGLNYYYSLLHMIMLIPFLLFLIHTALSQPSWLRFIGFAAFCVFAVSLGDVHSFVMFPLTIGVYGLITALGYHRFSFWKSMLKTGSLAGIFILSSAFYLIPLAYNLRMIAGAEKSFAEAGLAFPLWNPNLSEFLSFFYQTGFPTLFKPIEGSGLLLYLPIFFYVLLICALFMKNSLFRESPHDAVFPLALAVSALSMFFAPLVIYALPFLAKSGKGYIRSHLNLIPFLLLLAGFVVLSAVVRSKKTVKLKLFIVTFIVSFTADIFLFVVPHVSPESSLFMVRHALFYDLLKSSNLFPIRYSKDMWPWIPIVNTFPLLLVIAHSWVIKKYQKKKMIAFVLLTVSLVLALLTISLHNELRFQQARWQILFREPARYDSYLSRKKYIDQIIQRNDPEYRTLYAGKDIYGNSGRNWKSIAETEMNVFDKEKALFSYRETMHPYAGLLSSPLSNYPTLRITNTHPALSSRIPGKIDLLRFMGIKYVISAEEKIDSPELQYKGECQTKDSPHSEIWGPDGGPVYIYEVNNPMGVAFLVDKFKVVELKESLRTIGENVRHPWKQNEVYLEEEPRPGIRPSEIEPKTLSPQEPGQIKILKETFHHIDISVSAPQTKFLVLSYIYQPFWKAFIGAQELKVYRAYGGFMCVEIPPGSHVLRFHYIPKDVYLGLGLTLGLFALLLMTAVFVRKKSSLKGAKK